MSKVYRKEIWAQATPDSLRLLLSRIIDRVRGIAGPKAVDVYSDDHIKISWSNNWLNIECDSNGFWIHAPNQLSHEDISSWNEALESFHSNILEPIKDQLGGVATGIGYKDN